MFPQIDFKAKKSTGGAVFMRSRPFSGLAAACSAALRPVQGAGKRSILTSAGQIGEGNR